MLSGILGLKLRFVFDDSVTQDCRTYVAAISPHGVFPLSLIGLGVWRFREGLGELSDSKLTALRARLASASVLFWVPIVREIILLAGARDAARSNIERLLAEGHTIALNPGGIWEMVNSDPNQEKVYVQRNLGFIRIAMASGRSILPAYAFGENQLFRTSTWLQGPRLWIARHLRLGLPLFTGRWGLPLPLPLPTEVTLVMGKPIPVGPANPNPTDAQVEALFDAYTREMCRLFAENATKYLPPEVAARGLEVHRVGHGVVKHARL